MIKSANLLWHVGMTKAALYKNLMGRLPARSEEAIKRRLRLLKWHPEALAQQTLTPEGPPPQHERPIRPADPPPLPVTRIAGTRWTAEEDLLRASANISWKMGMSKKDLSSTVRATLPHRTADAITKRLTTVKWTLPTSPLLPIPPLPPPPTLTPNQTTSPSPSTTAGPYLYNEWRERMTDIILKDLREPPTQADRLREITLSLLENRISTSEGAMAVEEQVN